MSCIKCESDDFSGVTGWCTNYSEPLINDQCMTGPDRDMCCGVIEKLSGAYYCNECEALFDDDGNSISLNDAIGYSNSPIGKVIEDEF